MKKIRMFLMMAMLVLAGCAKSNPTAEELIRVFADSDNGSYIAETEVYTETTDPDQLLGAAHQYTEKIGLTDSRYNSDQDDAAILIEVFGNSQDAQIRYDYYQMVNECRKEFTESKSLLIDGSAVLKEAAVHLNGNIVMKAMDSMGHNVADAYFKIMDAYLGDTGYAQNKAVSDEEYETLHKENVEDHKQDVQKQIEQAASEYLDLADKEVRDQLEKYSSDMTDTVMSETEKLITGTYGAKYFDSLREEWTSEFDTISQLKAENEIQYQAEVDRINSLMDEAEADPTQAGYDAAAEAVAACPDNYYFKKFVSDWNKRLEELKKTLELIERDRSVEALNKRLDAVESSLNPADFDSINEDVNKYSNQSIYRDYISGWKDRLDAIEDDVDKERQKAKIKEFKDSCQKISYKEFSRNSNDYIGTPVYFKGEVVQVVDQDSSGAELRVNVTMTGSYYTYYTDTIYVEYDNSDEISTTKILEDDIIEIWGYGAGDVTYQTVLGSKMTIPAVLAKYIKVK